MKRPEGSVEFDPTTAAKAIEAFAADALTSALYVQTALLPPAVDAGESRLEVDVIRTENVTRGEIQWFVLVHGLLLGQKYPPTTIRVYGITADGELLFISADGEFTTPSVIFEERRKTVEHISRRLKDVGLAGNLANVFASAENFERFADDDED